MNTLAEERNYLRELAKKCCEIAALPVMEERRQRWLAHNRGEQTLPLIVVEEQSFVEDILPPLKCTDPATQAIERQLLTTIAVHELIDDDKVACGEFIVPLEISFSLFNRARQREFSKDSKGRSLGYHDKPVLTELTNGIPDFPPSAYSVHHETTIHLFSAGLQRRSSTCFCF